MPSLPTGLWEYILPSRYSWNAFAACGPLAAPLMPAGLWLRCGFRDRQVRRHHASSRKNDDDPNKKKKGSQSISKLVDVGRRLLSIDFVAFLRVYHDCQLNRVKPMANAAQSFSASAAYTHEEIRRIHANLAQDALDAEKLLSAIAVSAIISTKVGL